MNKYSGALILSVGMIVGLLGSASAQDEPVLTAALDNQVPIEAKTISAGAQNIDVARITLTASVHDVTLDGVYLATDVPGGLSNFTNLWVYDTYDNSLLGTYSNQNGNPIQIRSSTGERIIVANNGISKTFLIRASLSLAAAGNVRVGFSGFIYPSLATPTLVGIPVYGNVMTLPGIVSTPTPTPSLSPTPTPSASIQPAATPTLLITPSSLGFTNLTALGLKEGDTTSAISSNDPDIYIVNSWGYKRLFLNPVIFGFYGHLGGFAKVKNITSQTNSLFVTSGLFRNCETNDPKVYGVETTGEDTGKLHWVNTSGEQAVRDDPDFFKKVFCINSNEFNWYPKGSDYTSVNQISSYIR